MTRFSRVVIVAGAAVAMAALSEIGPTAAEASPVAAAAGHLHALSAPTPTASCTVTPTGGGYSVTVSWSGFSVTNIDLFVSGNSQPLSQTVVTQPKRKGSITLQLSTAPDYAQITGSAGLRVACV